MQLNHWGQWSSGWRWKKKLSSWRLSGYFAWELWKNGELGFYLYFNPTDPFFFKQFNSIHCWSRGVQTQSLRAVIQPGFSVLPGRIQVSQRQVGSQVKEWSSAGIRPLRRTGLGPAPALTAPSADGREQEKRPGHFSRLLIYSSKS